MRQPTCARPVSDRHAHPDWIGGGSESRQTMRAHSCGSMPAEVIGTKRTPVPLSVSHRPPPLSRHSRMPPVGSASRATGWGSEGRVRPSGTPQVALWSAKTDDGCRLLKTMPLRLHSLPVLPCPSSARNERRIRRRARVDSRHTAPARHAGANGCSASPGRAIRPVFGCAGRF
jgi:hypothetical protein